MAKPTTSASPTAFIPSAMGTWRSERHHARQAHPGVPLGDRSARTATRFSIALFRPRYDLRMSGTRLTSISTMATPTCTCSRSPKPVELPWEPGVAVCFGRAEGMDHKPVPIDPRNVLIRQVERASRRWVTMIQAGTELEFYLLDPETQAVRVISRHSGLWPGSRRGARACPRPDPPADQRGRHSDRAVQPGIRARAGRGEHPL